MTQNKTDADVPLLLRGLMSVDCEEWEMARVNTRGAVCDVDHDEREIRIDERLRGREAIRAITMATVIATHPGMCAKTVMSIADAVSTVLHADGWDDRRGLR